MLILYNVFQRIFLGHIFFLLINYTINGSNFVFICRVVKKWIYKIGIWILSISLFLVICGVILVNVYEDEIKTFIVEEINENLLVEVGVEDYDVTIWESFPNLSMRFKGVNISESSEISGKHVLESEKILLVFNLWDIFNENYKVTKVKIENGGVFLYERGDSTNFEIFKSTEGDTSESPFKLELLELTDMEIVYANLSEKINVKTRVDNLKLKGDFVSTDFKINCSAKGISEVVNINGHEYLKEKEFELSSGLSLNGDVLTFSETTLSVTGFNLSLSGGIELLESGNKYSLKYEAVNSSLGSLVGLIPQDYTKKMSEYKALGDFELNGTLTGISNASSYPHVDCEFSLSGASILEPSSREKVENIILKGSFTNGKSNTSEGADLKIQAYECQLGDQKISGSLRLNDFTSPYLNLKCNGTADLKKWGDFLFPDKIKMGGSIAINLHYRGKLKNLQDQKGATFNSEGSVDLNGVSLSSKELNMDFKEVNGHLDFGKDGLTFKSIKGKLSDNTFMTTGVISNLFEYIFGYQKVLLGSMDISLPEFSTEKLMSFENTSDEDTEGYKIPENLSFGIKLNSTHFKHKNVNLKDLSSSIQIVRGRFIIKELNAKMLDGSISLRGDISNLKEDSRLITRLYFEGSNLDIHKLFNEFDNFGQEEIKAEHLAGKLNASVQLGGIMNEKLELDKEMLYAVVSLKIENGGLINYKPLEALSKYVDVDELMDVRFSALENELEIKDGKIIIPKMHVSNSAMNLWIAGEHTFENYMNYKIQVKFSEILAAKYGKRFKSRNQSEDGASIFITMKGKGDDLEFSYDKVRVKKKINESVTDERKQLKDLINKEIFNIKQKDTTIKEDPIKEEYKDTEWDE
jgi:hypothetical protein